MSPHVLICGLGSIGRRHLRHFRALGCSPVDAYRTGRATLADGGQPAPDRVFRGLDEALAKRPDLVVVTNPTSMHVETALAALDAGANLLVEKPLAHTLEDGRRIAARAVERGAVVGVAQNLRFHPHLQTLRSWVREGGPLGRVMMARAHCGSYLPSWHPWEDYRRSYAARRELGGGAALTNIHEVDAVLWLLGPAAAHAGLSAELRPLGSDVDEASAFVLRHRGGAVSAVTLSFVENPPRRTLDLAGTAGSARLDLLAGTLTVSAPGAPDQVLQPPEGFDYDLTYRDQAAVMLAALDGRPGDVATLDQALHALEVVLSMEELT